MSSRWDERGTGTATGGPATRSARAESGDARHCNQNHYRRTIFVENHTDYPRRQKWIPLDTRSVVTVTARSVTGGAARLGATPTAARGTGVAHRLASGRMAHRHIDEMTVRLCRRSNIPRSSTLCPERGSGCGSSPSMVLARAFSIPRLRYDLCSRYAVHHGLIAGRYALCRVGLLFPTCVRGCAAQSPLIFKPGN
jgi:hypothetical protein